MVQGCDGDFPLRRFEGVGNVGRERVEVGGMGRIEVGGWRREDRLRLSRKAGGRG
jgi:hypothetical protein